MNDLIWKTFIVFGLCLLLVWVILYTYHPEFLLSEEDYSNKDSGNISKENDSLSARGRTVIFLSSLIVSLIISFVFYMIARKYHKT